MQNSKLELPKPDNRGARRRRLAGALVVAVLAAGGCGLVLTAVGADPQTALIAAGSAFGSAMQLYLLAVGFLADARQC